MSRHPKDKHDGCPSCGQFAVQRFDARVMMVDSEDRPTAYTQRTCEHCGNTYYAEPGVPFPESFENTIGLVFEVRSEGLTEEVEVQSW